MVEKGLLLQHSDLFPGGGWWWLHACSASAKFTQSPTSTAFRCSFTSCTAGHEQSWPNVDIFSFFVGAHRASLSHCSSCTPCTVLLALQIMHFECPSKLRHIKASAGCYGNFLYQTHPLFTLWADYVNE